MDRGLPAVVLGVVGGAVVGYLISRNLLDFAGGRSAFVGAASGAVGCLLSIGSSFADPDASKLRAPKPAEESSEVAEKADLAPVREPSARMARLRPAGSVALTIALTVPAAYVLTNALTS